MRALGANAQLKEKMLMNRSCKTIYVLEDRFSGVSGLTLSFEGKGLRQQQPEKSRGEMPQAAGPGLNRKAGRTPPQYGDAVLVLTRGGVQPMHLVGAVVRGATALQFLSCPFPGRLAWPLAQTLASL